MLSPEHQKQLQELLMKKQSFVQKAIKEIQNNKIGNADLCFNIDTGFNIQINKILGNYIEGEKEKVII